ncbi:MAG TPA: ATP-binding protein [Spirochaetota bacterium]|nr:ATP-binding protein [Spirochaetota bacterium]HOM38848.1 ATP-binding protein [Spirochaetota bacterium]HPQ49143.1 ATP-binding protein [Spirochaetota bacterium]
MNFFKVLLESCSIEDGFSKLYEYVYENYGFNIIRFYILSKNSFLSPIFVRGGTKLGHLSITEENSLVVRSYIDNREIIVRENDEEYKKNKLLTLNNVKFFIAVPFNQQGVITIESSSKLNIEEMKIKELIYFIKIGGNIILNLFFKKTVLESEIEEYSKKIISEVEKSNKLTTLGKLASSIVHEIKNPLTTINVLINQLIEENKDSSIYTDLTVIKDEVERINRLLKEFLLFAKPREPRKELVNVEQFLKDIHVIIRPFISQKSINFLTKTNIENILVDKDQLKQILLNLILNSVEAIKNNGSIKISFDKKIYSDKKYFVITVEDTGPGIDEEKIPYIFEPFFNENSSSTGLGLSIVNRLVQNNGGFIEFNNLLYGGACFNIYFPFDQV